MADTVVLTRVPVFVNLAGAQMALSGAIDVSQYDMAEFLLRVIAMAGTASPTVQIDIITGMQKESEDGWVIWASFTTVAAGSVPTQERKTADRPFKYIRWRVSAHGHKPDRHLLHRRHASPQLRSKVSILRTEPAVASCGCAAELRVDGACGCGKGGMIIAGPLRVVRPAAAAVDDRIQRAVPSVGDPRIGGGLRQRPPVARSLNAVAGAPLGGKRGLADDSGVGVVTVDGHRFYVCGSDLGDCAEIDVAVLGYMAKRYIPNGSLAIISNDGRLLYAKGFTNLQALTLAREAAPVLSCPRSQFRIASVSKVLTAVGVMKLFEAGALNRFGWNGPDTTMSELGLDSLYYSREAAEWIKKATKRTRVPTHANFARITVRQLLTHTSGIREDRQGEMPGRYQYPDPNNNMPPPQAGNPWTWYTNEDDVTGVASYLGDCEAGGCDALPVTRDQVLTMVASTELNPPGAWYNYANAGFMLLGSVIERLTGRDYESWMQENILAQCGAHATVLGDAERSKSTEVAYYGDAWAWEATVKDAYQPSIMSPSQPIIYWPRGSRNIRMTEGGGGWVSTAYDLARVMRNLFALPDGGPEARVVSGAGVALMSTTQAQTSSSYQMGLGFNTEWYSSTKRDRGKAGHWLGTQARMYHWGTLLSTGGTAEAKGFGYATLFNRYWTGFNDQAPAEDDFHKQLRDRITTLTSGHGRGAGPTGDLWGTL